MLQVLHLGAPKALEETPSLSTFKIVIWGGFSQCDDDTARRAQRLPVTGRDVDGNNFFSIESRRTEWDNSNQQRDPAFTACTNSLERRAAMMKLSVSANDRVIGHGRQISHRRR